MTHMSIGDVARATGLSVRTLRHWEEEGLVSPQRSEARQRVFGAKQLIRLGHIKSLKAAGFSLKDIRTMIARDALDAHHVMTAQLAILQLEKERIDGAIARLEDALSKTADGIDLSPAALCQLIKSGDWAVSKQACEAGWQKVYDTFYSETEQAAWAEAKAGIDPKVQEDVSNRWPLLIARVEQAISDGHAPASAEAQACVAEWRALVAPILAFNPALAESSAKLYDNMDQWPEGGAEPPFSPAVWDYIQQAALASTD